MWQDTLSHDRASAVVIQNGKVLLIHRHRDGKEYWVIPGGAVEEGETPEIAVRREVREELSVEAVSVEPLFSVENVGRTEHHFRVTLASGEFSLGGPEATIASAENRYEFVWVSAEDLAALPAFYPEAAREKILALLKEKIQ